MRLRLHRPLAASTRKRNHITLPQSCEYRAELVDPHTVLSLHPSTRSQNLPISASPTVGGVAKQTLIQPFQRQPNDNGQANIFSNSSSQSTGLLSTLSRAVDGSTGQKGAELARQLRITSCVAEP